MRLTDSRSYNIQMLRGLAIIAVVFIHNTPSGIAQVWYRPFLNFAVGLFLFMSGMLSDSRKWKPRKRIIKVIIPYILWTLVYVILLSKYDTFSNIPVIYVKQLITGRAAAIMYYVFIYCEFTLLIPLIDKLANSKYKYIGFIISPIEIILMRLLPLIFDIQVNNYVDIIQNVSCLGWFSYFYFGYLLGNSRIILKVSNRKLAIFWGISIISQIIEGYIYFCLGEPNCGTQLKLTSLLSGILFCMLAYRFICTTKNICLKLLYVLGNISFGIYFSHISIMVILSNVPFYSKYVIYPFNTLITILISCAFVHIGRKNFGKYSKYLAL